MSIYSEVMEKIKENNKKNPCGLCEEVDCEGCEYFDEEKGDEK